MGFLRNRTGIITYTVDKNRNNDLYISVQNGEVVVQAPWYFSRSQIQEIVEEKKRWIIDKIKEYETHNNTGIIEILGKKCAVEVHYENRKNLNVDINREIITIELPNKYKKVNKKELLNSLIEKIYNVVAEKEIERAMEKTRILLGYAPEDYKLDRVNGILGTCLQNKNIIINPDIVKYNQEIIEYVVMHEFLHLKYKTHSKKFYEIKRKYIPNYEEYAKEINGWKY